MNRPIITELEAKIRELMAQKENLHLRLELANDQVEKLFKEIETLRENEEHQEAQLAKYREALEKIASYYDGRSIHPDHSEEFRNGAGNAYAHLGRLAKEALAGDEGKHE